MNDVRWSTGDDCVVLVLTCRRVTLGSALLQTVHFFEAEIPAARALTKIAADGAEVSNVWCGYRVSSFGEAGKIVAHSVVFLERRERHNGDNGWSVRLV